MAVLPSSTAGAAAGGPVLYVATGGRDAGTCQQASTPCASIGYAIGVAPPGAMISVGRGTFHEKTLILRQPVSIDGAGAASTVVDADRSDPACPPSTGYVSVVSINGSSCPSGPSPTPGQYQIRGVTLEGVPAGSTPQAEPVIVLADGLTPGISIDLRDDAFVTSPTLDPNVRTDFPVAFYTFSGYTSDHLTFAGDRFEGMTQGVFVEDFPGTLSVRGSTFTAMSPGTTGGLTYAPVGVFILADDDAAGPDTNGYSVTANSFSGYAGYGVLAQAGYPPSYKGTIAHVTIAGNRFDLPAATDGRQGASSPVALEAFSDGGNALSTVTVDSNFISTRPSAGSPGVDVRVGGTSSGSSPNTVSSIAVRSNDLLGGRSVVGIQDDAATTVDGTANFWGAPGGPGAPGSTIVARSSGGKVPSAPFVNGYIEAGPHIPEGYWLVGSDGGVFSFGNARYLGSLPGAHVAVRDIVQAKATPDGGGYWLAGADGGVFSFGDARFRGSMGGRHLHAPVVGMAPAPDGNGYWLVANDGGVFAFGSARYRGSLGGSAPSARVIGISATPDGLGYWLVTSSGTVTAFGDARSFPLVAGERLVSPVHRIGRTTDGGGYWLLASGGSLTAFGDAPPAGPVTAGSTVGTAATGLARTPDGYGLWTAGGTGAVAGFGDARYLGSLTGAGLDVSNIVSIAAT